MTVIFGSQEANRIAKRDRMRAKHEIRLGEIKRLLASLDVDIEDTEGYLDYIADDPASQEGAEADREHLEHLKRERLRLRVERGNLLKGNES